MYNRSERNFVVEFLCVTFCYRYQCSLKYDLKSQKKVNETVSVEVCWVIYHFGYIIQGMILSTAYLRYRGPRGDLLHVSPYLIMCVFWS